MAPAKDRVRHEQNGRGAREHPVKIVDDLLVSVIQVAAVGLLLKLDYAEVIATPWILAAGTLCFIHMFIYHLNFHHMLSARKGSDAVFHWLVVFFALSIVLYPITLGEMVAHNFLPYTLLNMVACALLTCAISWARYRGWLVHADWKMRVWYTVAPWVATGYYGVLAGLAWRGFDVIWLCFIAPLFFANPPGRYLNDSALNQTTPKTA